MQVFWKQEKKYREILHHVMIMKKQDRLQVARNQSCWEKKMI